MMRMGEMGFIPEAGYEVPQHKACIIITDIMEAKEDN